MTEGQFWRLGHAESAARFAEWVDGEMELEQVICPISEGHRRGGKRLTNLSVALRGKRVEDFVWTWCSDCLIQDHVLELFRKSGFTGFDVRPVKAKFKRASGGEPPRLWELVVTGWAGIAPPESGIKLIDKCVACGLDRYSAWTNADKLIEPRQWDGSDFFMVWPLARYVFVTNRVVELFHDSKLSGVVVTPSTKLFFSPGVIPGLSGGRLSYWMPEERARELGEPLGIY